MDTGFRQWVEGFGQDLRQGARVLLGAPGFTLAAAVCLGIGIGLATSTFTQFQATVFKTTPGVTAPDSLVSFQAPVSFPDFEHHRDSSGQFAAATALLAPVPFVVTTTEGNPERLWGHVVTSDHFQVLGVKAAAGRLFDATESIPGSTSVVISHRLWTTRFASRRDLVGAPLRINGQAMTVVGVADPVFHGATPMLAVADLWIPVTAQPRFAPELQGDVLRNAELQLFQVFGRLKPGIPVASAEVALDTLARRLEAERGAPDRFRDGRRITLLPGGRVFPIREQDLPAVTAFPAVLVSLILMVACVNVATMLVARAAARHREIAIRLSLGAGRPRLIRQLLTEYGLLGMLGGGAGLLFAFGYHGLMTRFLKILPSQMHYDWQIDWRAFLAAFGIAGLSALAFGLAPALQASRADLATGLKGGAAPVLRGQRWFSLRNVLVVQQIMASLTLLLLTAFVVVGFNRSNSIDLGFAPGNLFMLSLDPVRDGHPPEVAAEFFAQLPLRVQQMPGVRRAALAQSSPFGLNAGQAMMATKSDFGGGPQLLQTFLVESVGAGFFETLGVPVLAGRTLRESDERGDSAVIVINQTLAHENWPEESALGRTLELDGKIYEVVGVVGNIGAAFSLGHSRPCAYRPNLAAGYTSPSAQGVTLFVRAETGVDVPLLVGRQVGDLLPNLTVFNVSSMTEQVERMASVFRMTTAIYGGIGAFGLVLAAVGLAGVTAYAVTRRTHEIGIRRALGAPDGAVLWLVLREGIVLIAIGTVLGLALAYAAVQIMSAILSTMAEITRTSIHDPLVLVGAPVLLAGLALLACYLPARRSLRINPAEAMRSE